MKFKPYPEYKNSGVEWIGEIPKSWETHRFKINFKYSKGRIPENLHDEPKDNSLPYLSMDYLRGNESDVLYSDNDPKAVEVNEGDLLLLWDGSNAGEFVEGKRGYLSSTMVKLSLENINSKYSNYLCRAFEPLLRDLTIGMGIPHVNGDNLGNIRITHPNFGEQKQIASFLDKKTSEIDKTIQKDTQLIELLKEKRTALINHVVTKGLDVDARMKDSGVEWIGEIPEGWEIDKIKNRVTVRISNIDKKTKENEPDVLLCNYTDVYNNEFITSKLDFMKATANIEQVKRLSLEKSDVIITKDSETAEDIAVPALVKEELNNVVCGYHLALLRPIQDEITGDFLFRLLQSKKINDQFVIAANGVTRFGISTYPIKNSYIVIPPLDEQNIITNYLDAETFRIDKATEKIKNKINLMEEYKKSLIHHVVTGKVDVRGV